MFRTRSFLLLCVAVLLSFPAVSGATDEIPLEPTAQGQLVGTSGLAAMWQRDTTEFFSVRASADLPDGTVLIISVWDGEASADIGSVTMNLGSGMLRLNSTTHSTSPAFPISEVLQVRVRQVSNVLAIGSSSDEFRPIP